MNTKSHMVDLHTAATQLVQTLDPILGSDLSSRFSTITGELIRAFAFTAMMTFLTGFWGWYFITEMPQQIGLGSILIFLFGVICTIVFAAGTRYFFLLRNNLRTILHLQQTQHRIVRNEYELFEQLYETLTSGIMTGTAMLPKDVAQGQKPATSDLEQAELTRLSVIADQIQARMPRLQAWAKEHTGQVSWAATIY